MPSQVPSSIATTIGLNIVAARRIAGLTQLELATRIGVDPMMVSKWERGWHRPSDTNLLELARVLDRDLAYFYTEAAA